MSDPLETITATREQLESAVNEQAVLHAQALARDAVELRDRVFLERESGFRQHADNFVENLRAEHEQEKRLMADAMKALEAKNAELQAAWSASQTQGAQLAQQAQQAQDKFEYVHLIKSTLSIIIILGAVQTTSNCLRVPAFGAKRTPVF